MGRIMFTLFDQTDENQDIFYGSDIDKHNLLFTSGTFL